MSTTRRAILAGASAVVAVPAAIVPAKAATAPDAALVAAADEFVRLNSIWLEGWQVAAAMPPGAARDKAEEDATKFFDTMNYSERMEAIVDLPALTLAGMQAKARAVAAHYGADEPDDAALLWSLAQDVLTMEGAAP